MIHAIEYGRVEMPLIPSFAVLSWRMASLIYHCRTRDLLLTRLLSGASIPEEPYEA